MSQHIHTPDDGRGRRRVRVDGRVVERVVYADTLAGVVRHHGQPPQLVGGEVVEHTVHGNVEVEYL